MDVINSEVLKGITKGFKAIYDKAFNKTEAQWQRIAMRVPSKTSENVYSWLGATSRMREWLGERVIQKLKLHDFSIKNKKWESTVSVQKTDVEDDNLGVYTPIVEQLGEEAAAHPDVLVFEQLNKSFETPCYDGQYLIDTDHPVLDENGNTIFVSNHGGGSGEKWFLIDDTKSIKPIIYQDRAAFEFKALDNPNDQNVFMKDEFIYGVDGRNNVGVALWQLVFGSKQELNATNYAALRKAMISQKGDNGRPMNVKPALLVVGPSNEAAAKEILEAERNANGATNIHRNTAQLLVSPYLD